MPKTMISSIGIGRKNTDTDSTECYSTTQYEISGELMAATPFFVSAWLEHDHLKEIDHVHLIGSASSSWSALIETYQSENEILWVALEDAQIKGDIEELNQHLPALESVLSKAWQRQTECHVLFQHSLTHNNADDVLTRLIHLFPTSDLTREVVIDTTHGFRTLPLLALSAVQIADGLSQGFAQRVELIYGEYHPQHSRGYHFTTVQDNLRLARALAYFEDTLDADSLADQLSELYPKVADALRRLSISLGLNLYHQLNERLRQLTNSLSSSKPKDGELLSMIFNHLQQFVKILSQPTLACQIFELARLRAQRGQYGFALLALAESVLAIVCEGQPVRDYDEVKRRQKIFRQTIRNWEDQRRWDDLFILRNRVAHGGNLIDQNVGITDQSIHQQYDRMERFVQKLLQERG